MSKNPIDDPSRTPPTDVRLRLRREVDFGCPVEGCSSPFLTYHHFDPPWREGHTHHEPGMIALCREHHGFADGGTWEDDDLRKMKASPAGDRAKPQRLNWKRAAIILAAGGGFMARSETFLLVRGHRLVWVTRDNDGRALLNLDIRRANGQPLFRMTDNDWIVSGEVEDLEAKPIGRSLLCKGDANGVAVSLDFRDVSEEQFRGETGVPPSVADEVLDWPALLVSMTATVVFPLNGRITKTGMSWPGILTGSPISGAGANVAICIT